VNELTALQDPLAKFGETNPGKNRKRGKDKGRETGPGKRGEGGKDGELVPMA